MYLPPSLVGGPKVQLSTLVYPVGVGQSAARIDTYLLLFLLYFGAKAQTTIVVCSYLPTCGGMVLPTGLPLAVTTPTGVASSA
jgi:hypothetical protein